jgi:class 3 adenylate cyclase/CHASE2 domain-containing sensor protein
MGTAGRGAAARDLWRAIAGRAAMVLIVLAVLSVLAPRLSENEVRVLDFLYSVTPCRALDRPIALVDIDDPKRPECSCGPTGAACRVPRHFYKDLVDRLRTWDAKVIVFDLRFEHPCPDSDKDKHLAEAFEAAGNVIVAACIPQPEQQPVNLEPPPGRLGEAVWAVGSELLHDPTRTVRCVPLLAIDRDSDDMDSDQQYWAISLLAFERLHGVGPHSAVARGDSVEVAGVTVPVVREERICLLRVDPPADLSFRVEGGSRPSWVPETLNAMFINWAGPDGTFRKFRIGTVLEMEYAWGQSLFDGKAVIVGHGDDSLPTPMGYMSGMEVHANALNTLVSGAFIRAVPWWAMLAIMGLFAGVTGEAVRRFRGVRAAGAALLLMAAAAILARQLLAGWGLWMYLFCCDLGIVLTWGATSVAESDKTTDMLSRFVPSFLQGQGGSVPGQVRTMEASVLYSDIRGYTGMAEQLHAEEVMRTLEPPQKAAEEAIVRHGGAIVKTPGDAIVAVFWRNAGGRNHATCAVQAGEELLEAWATMGAGLEIGVGIDAGEVAMGLVGTHHLEPTVIGDAVNVAERLERLTKTLGCPLVFSESVRERLPAEVQAVRLDEVTVRNRRMPLQVYGLRGLSHAVLHGGSKDEATGQAEG